jgi:hypothetical protein
MRGFLGWIKIQIDYRRKYFNAVAERAELAYQYNKLANMYLDCAQREACYKQALLESDARMPR